MTRVVYGLALFLVLCGVAFAIIGLANFRTEQGALELVSGSVLISAACMMVGLGAILQRLELGLHTAVGTRLPASVSAGAVAVASQPLTSLEIFGAPAAEAATEPATMAPADHAAAGVIPEPAIEEVQHGAQEPTPPESGPDLDLERAISAELARPVPPLPPNEPALEPPPAAKPRPSLLSGLFRKKAAKPAPVEPAALDTPDDPSSAPPLVPHLDQPGLDLEPFGPETQAPNVEHASDHDLFGDHAPPLVHDHYENIEGTVHEPHEPAESQLDHEEVHDAPAPHEPIVAEHPLRPAAAAAPTVVGRYNAGSASYVMYSNGMIEVETDSGVHQFNSMQELKSFIERQEAAQVGHE